MLIRSGKHGFLESEFISSTELSTGCFVSVTLCQQQQIARRQWGFAEGAEANVVAFLSEEKRSVQHQPKLQWPSEKAPHQFQVAHLGQALMACSFQSDPIRRADCG